MLKRATIALLAVTTLSACGSTGGLSKRAGPDEFAVTRQAPLIVPPDFALAAPTPGAPRPQDGDTQTQVLEALFGGPAARSASEAAVIGSAGVAEPGIRSTVGDPGTQTVDKGGVTRDILAAPEGDGPTAQAAIPTN